MANWKTWSRQSFSSQKWLHDAGEALRNFVRHIENSKFGEHVIGYHICAGVSGEWSYYWGGEFYDYSKPHLEAFRKWLCKRYGDVEKLRKAWRDEKVTFEPATITHIDGLEPSHHSWLATGITLWRA